MRTTNRTPTQATRKLVAAGLATFVVVTANLLAMEAEYGSVAGEAITVERTVPAAPAPIDVEAFDPPSVAELPPLESLDLMVPELRRPHLGEPALGRLYEQARTGRSGRVMAAPTAELVADPPVLEVSAIDAQPILRVPALERPELPAPPPVQ